MSNSSLSNEVHCFKWIEQFSNNTNTTLEEMNHDFLERNLGGIVFISVMLVVGLFGNISVIGIFATKFKTTNYRTYTLWLAGLDLTNCCLGMPFLLIYHTNFLMFPSIAVCKGGRFVNVFTATASGFLLVVIAIDRYIFVCKPCNVTKISNFRARVCCVVAAIAGLVFSWPALLLYGDQSFGKYPYDKLPFNISGHRCWLDDVYRDTNYLSDYYIVLSALSFVITIVLFVMYSLVVRYIYKNKITNRVQHTKKVTLILLAITIAYVVSSLPHTVIIILLLKYKYLQCKLTFTQGSLLYIFVWLNLVNNVVNPIIYGFSDANFRREMKYLCLRLYRSLQFKYSISEINAREDQARF